MFIYHNTCINRSRNSEKHAPQGYHDVKLTDQLENIFQLRLMMYFRHQIPLKWGGGASKVPPNFAHFGLLLLCFIVFIIVGFNSYHPTEQSLKLVLIFLDSFSEATPATYIYIYDIYIYIYKTIFKCKQITSPLLTLTTPTPPPIKLQTQTKNKQSLKFVETGYYHPR